MDATRPLPSDFQKRRLRKKALRKLRTQIKLSDDELRLIFQEMQKARSLTFDNPAF
ncbi:hypothetical protein AJ78_09069, partial [Emergomyces pasteurianus Ep9510]